MITKIIKKYGAILLLFCLSSQAFSYDTVGNAFHIVNQKRSARGLKPYIFDSKLQALCEEITFIRGTKLHSGHLRKPMYSTLAHMEGVGIFGGIDLEAKNFQTCYLYERKQYTVGAAYCVDDSGRTFYTLILK